MLLPFLGGPAERRTFCRVFAVCLVVSGVAAIYGNQLQDEYQLYGDAGAFYDLATSSSSITLQQLQVQSEGSLAIYLWRSVYDFFSLLGFEKARYIGILMNVTMVSLTGVVGVKIIHSIFGRDDVRIRRFALLISCSGIFWLFAGIHLRDSVVCLLLLRLLIFFSSSSQAPWAHRSFD